MRGARSVLLAVLIVAASVVGSVGLVGSSAAQTDTYAQEFTTGPHKVEIDLTNVTTETTISVITSESPAGDNATIMKKTVAGTQDSAHFRNAGAYGTFTVQVAGADAKPGFSKGGVTDAWTPGDSGKFLGDTGGDADFTYDLREQIGESVQPEIVQLDRTGLPGSKTVNTTGTDASQTKLDLYQSAQNSKAQSENYKTSLDNYLSDTKTQARIIGKNAYIKALNNGSSKSAAKTEAKTAVSDYYAVKQRNLINSWNQKLSHGEYMKSVASSETGISSLYVGDVNHSVTYTSGSVSVESSTYNAGSTSVTLANGETMQATQASVTLYAEASDGSWSSTDTQTYGPLQQDQAHPFDGTDNFAGKSHGIAIQSDSTSTTRFEFVDFGGTADRFNEIESQKTTVQNDIDTLAENTYSAYQQGEINNTDLVDPYVLANQQSAGSDFQGWTAAQLTLLGTNSPDNFDQIGSFKVVSGSQTYEGVLFSQENPASGQFENGTTYDTANIGGTQYVVTSDEIVELSGSFTVEEITSQDGTSLENATIQKTQYQTTNTTELKQLYEDLAYQRAQIEAREQALAGGGGFSFGGQSGPIAIVAVAGAALLLLKD